MDLIVGFSRPKKWKPFAKAIMFFENSDYSHVYLKFFSKNLNTYIIYQASHSMVNFMGYKVFTDEAHIVHEYKINIREEQKNELLSFLVENSGKSYGVTQIIGLCLYKLFSIKFFINKDKKFICSELVARILYGLKIPMNFKYLDFVSPKDIKNLVDKNPDFIKINPLL